MKRLLLIDGHSVVYRSYFAFIRQPLRNSKGRNTSAVFGFANTIRKLLKELKPDYCAVVFDAPGRTFRHERFEEYKIERPETPDELREQIPVVKELVKAWGLSLFEVPGVEADDVLGSLARKGAEEGLEVTIATSDKDMLQLVGGRVVVYDPWKEKRFESKDVKDRLGVEPEQIPDYLALAGDAIDNVPGVPGIGPKRALEMLERYGSLEAAVEKDERVKEHAELARLSKELAEIHTGLEIEAKLDDLKPREPDRKQLARIYEELEFHSLLKELGQEQAPEAQVTVFESDAAERTGRFGFSYERRKGLWLSLDGRAAMFVGDLGAINRLLSRERVLKIGHGIKDAMKLMRQDGIELVGPIFDVGIGAWLVDPNRKRYELDDVMVQTLSEVGGGVDGAARAVNVYRLFMALEPQIGAMGLERVAYELEMPLVFVLAKMEERGVKVDLSFFASLEQELTKEQQRIEQEVWRLAGTRFNIGSPKQLGKVLFEKLSLPKGRRTKTGYSTGQDVLEDLALKYPIARLVLDYRELDKLCNTYLRPLRQLADKRTHRIHATFNQTGTATGRLSATNPNLQNIPIRSEIGRRVRNGFIADDGMALISADYSQIELRVLAHVTHDERLCEAFERGEDIHAATAAAILNIDISQVTEEHRRIAKMVNYGLIYGMGDYGLSWRMDIPVEEARQFVDEYMTRFPGVARWRERLVEQAKEDGFVRTISGRIRPVPGIAGSNRVLAEAQKRAALNAPMQGSAADIIKQAMINVEERLAREGIKGGMILQVHDELLFEVANEDVGSATACIREEMEGAWKLDVPLVVEIGTGRSWGEAH
ncbi:MAG: DNA polymerase I [candidate division WOR-3 bacterium]